MQIVNGHKLSIGDAIVISYSNGMTIGLFHSMTDNSIRYYSQFWGSNNKDIRTIIKANPSGNSYIYGDNMTRRILPYDLELCRDSSQYDYLKRLQTELKNEYQTSWSDNGF